MKNNNIILFKEKQYMKDAWVWLLLFALSTGSFAFLVLTYDASVENKFTINNLLVFGSILGFLFLALYILFRIMYLDLLIKSDYIEYKYFPFVIKAKRIYKEDIISYEIKKYIPREDNINSKGKKYIRREYYYMSRELGLFLILKDNKIIMLGTQRKQAIQSAMNKLMQGS
jgi:hypothetical protein